MRYFWSRCVIFFLMIEAFAFIIYYNFGPHGRAGLDGLTTTKYSLQQDIEKNKNENNDLQDQIEVWKNSLFLQEKFAREKLALQKENEIIYFK